jgi:hypothetical protein
MSRFPFGSAQTIAAAIVSCACAQESASVFKASIVVGDAQTSLRAVLDFDGDGAPDALSAWSTANADPAPVLLRGYRNVAGALVADWTLNVNFPTGSNAPIKVVAAKADFDGDGLDDFVAVGGRTVHAFRSNGAGATPSTAWTWTPATNYRVDGIAVADFDLDGDDDAAVVAAPTTSGLPTNLTILLTESGTTPTVGSTRAIPAAAFHRLATISLDGVAPRDVVALAGQTSFIGPSSNVSAVPTGPGGSLGVPTSVAAPPGFMNAAVGDLDGDGDEDLLATVRPLGVIGFGGPPQRTIFRNASGALVAETATTGEMAGHLADLDGDGDLDGVGGLNDSLSLIGTSGLTQLHNVGVSLQDATGALVHGFGVVVAGTGAAGLADLDADGDVDFVLERGVYYAGGATQPPYPHGTSFGTRTTVVDADGDGDPDLDHTVATALRNDGAGFFSATAGGSPPPVGTTFRGRGLRIDFDGDGDLDQLASTLDNTGANATVRRVNRGDGFCADGGPASAGPMSVLTSTTSLPNGLESDYAWVVDADGDGDLDVVTSYKSLPFPTVVWLNDGSGYFTSLPATLDFAVGGTADFDGDGLDDLVGFSGAAGAATLEVRRAVGGGLYAAPGTPGGFAPFAWATSLAGLAAVGDFDGDGLLDVAAPQIPSTPGVAWYRYDGSQFVLGASVPTPLSGFAVASDLRAADLDLDGTTDLVMSVVTANSSACAVLRNAGGGVFSAPTVHAINVADLADLDGDGDLDAIGAVLVALNRSRNVAAEGLRLQYGTGSAGSGGAVPVLGAAGLRGAGEVHEFRLRGCLGGAAGLFGAGALQLNQPLFGSTLLAFPEILLPFTTTGAPGVAGAGGYDLPFLVPPQIAGFPFFHQVAIADPAAPSGLAFSNGLMVVYGA